ncbi:conjugal transfer protein [Paenibacillus sp. PL91]|uniref:conjugal transfer protein n=1 Tax=Paenibacillus sp. PL91 TaxID=2729538 RepID=UPI00145D33C3|nr:conjugal transfer protein [Paenibacillus sp. PL91]MBC9204715.1 conjugal transfer protein [Paenibacillus sp. PL91]
MGFIKKKNKSAEVDLQDTVQIDKAEDPKKKSDKSIKPRSPKSMAGKKVLRTVIWIVAGLIFLKGAIAWSQGTRIINETNIYGSNETIVSDSVKGFATDFATEYFTWDADFTADRNKRISKFIRIIEADMGLKSFDVKSSSKVSSAEVYGSVVLDDTHIDVTVVVWRTVTMLPNQIEAAKGTAEKPVPITKKAYMVVPITLAAEGPVIESYPRFVSEQTKGSTVDPNSQMTLVGDSTLIEKGAELADSYLRSWYEGNVTQLKYFYADNVKPPASLVKSEFTYDSLKKVSIFSIPSSDGTSSTYRIKADVIVKSDLGEPFSNAWYLNVVEKDGKLFVLSNGIKQPEEKVSTVDAKLPTDDVNPASPGTDTGATSATPVTDSIETNLVGTDTP